MPTAIGVILLTFSWDFKTLHGVDAVKSWLVEHVRHGPGARLRLEGEPTIGAIGEHPKTLEFFFRFETRSRWAAATSGSLATSPRAADLRFSLS